jgi:hypothetical protein
MPEGLLTETPVENSSQESGEDVFASIPRELRFSGDGNDKLAKFGGDNVAMATSYLELQNLDSGKVKMPTDASTPEERSAFYQKAGRPDNVEGYTLPQLAEGQEYDKDLVSAMQAVAFDSGVSNKQFEGLVTKFVESQGLAAEAQLVAQNAEAEATVKDLQSEWGGEYEKNLEVSKRALRELVPDNMKDDLINLITEKNLDNNKLFVKFLQSVGSKTLDDTFVKGEKVQEKVDDYVPRYRNSPEMYRNGDDEEAQKGRAWHTKQGFIY